MILTPDQLQQVNEGKKTMHRLPATARDCRYQEGHAYTVRTSDRSGSAKVTVMAEPRRERLGDIPPADAIREGHRHTRAFFDHWTETHGKLDLDQEVDVVLFLKGDHRDVDRYLARGGPAQTCNAMIDDPDRPGKKRRCGAAFSDDPEPQRVCRCGARRRDVGMDDIGYTTSSRRGLPGEPPAVPPDVQDAQTADAHIREVARKANAVNEARELTLEQRVRRLQRTARERGIDVSREIRVMTERTERAERAAQR